MNNRTSLEKLLILIISIISIYAIVVNIQKAVYKYKYFQNLEKEYTTAKDSIKVLNLQIKDLTKKQQIKTKSVQKKSNTINDKLKQDEETINNTPITDDDLADFIAKHENG